MTRVRAYLPLAFRVIVGGMFILAGAGKIGDRATLTSLGNFLRSALPGIGDTAASHVGYLPLLEVALGVLLVYGLLTRFHSIATALLLCGFIAVLTLGAIRGVPLTSCNCFGSDAAGATYGGTIARDIAMLLAVLFVTFAGPGPISLDRISVKRREGRGGSWITLCRLFLPVGTVLVVLVAMSAASVSIEKPVRLGAIVGKVVDESGVGVTGCRVLGENGQVIAFTDKAGRFEALLDAATSMILVVPPDTAQSLVPSELVLPVLSSERELTSTIRVSIRLRRRD